MTDTRKISTQFLSYMPSAEAWQATEPNYEPGMPIGVGPTEEDAIADLRMEERLRREDKESSYPGRSFPQVEDESDLQSMLDGLVSEHERGN